MENFYGEYITLEYSDHELAEITGKTVASVLSPKNRKNPLVIVGRDGGMSAGSIADSVCRGICSAGIPAEKLGIVSPPVISCLAEIHDADAGIMITSLPDGHHCGIRLYSSGGYKLSYETGEEIKRIIFKSPEELEKRIRNKKGGVIVCENAIEEYISFIRESVNEDFSGMKIAVRCSDGKNNEIAVRLFTEMGADVEIIPEDNETFKTEDNFDCGFIFRNDGESCTVIDEKGFIIDNDRLMAVFAKYCRNNNLLKNNVFVVTYGAGYGFMKFAEENNITVVTAGFDENSIIARMTEDGYSIGADSNGRIIFLDDIPAGDGFFTAVKLLSIMRKIKSPLSELADMRHYSQVSADVEIPLNFREIWKNDCVITDHIARYIHLLGNRGKIFVHENSVIPAIDIKAEGMDYVDIDDAVRSIAEKIRERIIRKEY
ncbi:MAG: hypothetical protein K2K02_08705 [Ruminococcus sp.]|nr:hypothetical protein [Ruminococcus sp.]